MNILVGFLLIAVVCGIAIAGMLAMRRRAPEGGFVADGDRAAGVFGVIATGFSVLLGFLIFLAFESYDASRTGAETEALTVAQQVETAQRLPTDVREDLTGQLVCYARWVVNVEWDQMEDGTLDDQLNPWGPTMFSTLQGRGRSSQRSRRPRYDQWLEQTSTRQLARQDRIHGAAGGDADAVVDRPVLHRASSSSASSSRSPTAANGRPSRRCTWAAPSPRSSS